MTSSLVDDALSCWTCSFTILLLKKTVKFLAIKIIVASRTPKETNLGLLTIMLCKKSYLAARVVCPLLPADIKMLLTLQWLRVGDKLILYAIRELKHCCQMLTFFYSDIAAEIVCLGC
jgi:hypothetical protein